MAGLSEVLKRYALTVDSMIVKDALQYLFKGDSEVTKILQDTSPQMKSIQQQVFTYKGNFVMLLRSVFFFVACLQSDSLPVSEFFCLVCYYGDLLLG